MINGRTAKADCETGLKLCDQALTKCDEALEAQRALAFKQSQILAAKQEEIKDLKDHDQVFYRQPAIWLVVGALTSIINPAVGIPLIAAGVSRAL
jgi:hypothetical protein